MQGKSTRIGTYKCYQCRKQFTVKVGTVFEASHVPLHVWLQAVALLTSSKKGMSSNQLHRVLGVTLKTAWFMSHRIREAMRNGTLSPMGGSGKIVEADETYQGRRSTPRDVTTSGRPFIKKGKKGTPAKRAIIALVERGGEVRSFHVENADKATVNQIVGENIARESRIITDESRLYTRRCRDFRRARNRQTQRGEYVRYDDGFSVHSNTVENVFSILKRGMTGVYQHCAEKHLHRYLAEFDFRYNNRIALGVNDTMRADQAIKGIVGKRLTYRTTSGG